MACFLIAWELGGEHGHVDAFAPLATALRARGHEVRFALRDLSRAEPLLASHGFTVAQAPVWAQVLAGGPPAGNHAEVLLRTGYLDGVGVSGLVRGWRALFDLIGPDCVVAHYAPTAVLAARGTGIRVAGLGTAFHLPPVAKHLPALVAPELAPPARLRAAEQHVVAAANAAMRAVGGPALAHASELFACTPALLCTFPELDAFAAQRADCRYFGPRLAWRTPYAPAWPERGVKRVFVYLKGRYRETPAVLAALDALGHSVIAYVPGLPPQAAAKLRSPRLALCAQPASFREVAGGADLVVCNAGHGTAGGALLLGRALLLFPAHVEQQGNATALAGHGLARTVSPLEPLPELRRVLAEALNDAALARRAADFAGHHADFSEERQVAELAGALEQGVAR